MTDTTADRQALRELAELVSSGTEDIATLSVCDALRERLAAEATWEAVSAGHCPRCEKRREDKKVVMKRWREKHANGERRRRGRSARVAND